MQTRTYTYWFKLVLRSGMGMDQVSLRLVLGPNSKHRFGFISRVVRGYLGLVYWLTLYCTAKPILFFEITLFLIP